MAIAVLASCSAGSDSADIPEGIELFDDTGRLIVQSGQDVMEALFEGTLVVTADGCTSAESGKTFDVIWPLDTRWSEAERAVVLADGTRLVDGTQFRTGGGVVPLTVDESDEWLQSSTVSDETTACLVHDEVLVIGDFETVIDP